VNGFWGRVREAEEAGAAVASATVVSRRAPVSSHVGDRAFVYPDGRMEGFVGGACSREIVRRHALEALRTGRARLVKIRPASAPAEEADGDVVLPMGCVSEGAADIYIEPHLPRPTLMVVGSTPVAATLGRLGQPLDYRVVRVVEEDEMRDVADGATLVLPLGDLPAFVDGMTPASRSRMMVVVASQGHYDDEALAAVLRSGAEFIGLLASRARGAAVLAALHDVGGFSLAETSLVRTPVGIDIGAKEPGEVAVSILAEIIAHQIERQASARMQPAVEVERPGATAVDPVCKMDVDPGASRRTAEHQGETYYFCGPGCRAAFLREPAAYAASSA
jgi:xanthine dehydrogenase accessory factor